jgi:hypothetical protein
MWAGNDAPGEWLFYWSGTTCCLLPVTGTMGWMFVRTPEIRHVGRGVLAAVAVAVVFNVAAVAVGYAPPWINDDPV